MGASLMSHSYAHSACVICQASNDVLPFRALVGARLRMNTAVVIASPQNLAGMPLAFIMDRSILTTVWFYRSTTPFYCGEYGVVWCRTTP